VGTSGGPSVTGVVVQPNCGLSTGSINLTVTNGTTPYTFDWSVNALDGIEDPTGLAAGTYAVTVTDAASCVTSTSCVDQYPRAIGHHRFYQHHLRSQQWQH
jgi:hypothetical protein